MLEENINIRHICHGITHKTRIYNQHKKQKIFVKIKNIPYLTWPHPHKFNKIL